MLSESTENNYDEQEVTVESLSSVSKRQTNFQNDNLNQQQVKYFVQNITSNLMICSYFSLDPTRIFRLYSTGKL